MTDSKRPPHQLSPKVHLERAQGYFELKMFEEAAIELNAVQDELPWSKQRRMLQTFLHQETEDWASMKDSAKSLRFEFPHEEDWWVSEAYATRRAESLVEARKILIEGLTIHYESAIIRYNLACYACQLNSPGESLDFLKEAVRRDEKYKVLALHDEDLKMIRDALVQMGWENTPI